MKENKDINAGTIISEGESLESKGKEIFDMVIDVASE